MRYHLGPIDQWQSVLDATSKSGLVDLIEYLVLGRADREECLRLALAAKKHGRYMDEAARWARFKDDPEREIEASLRRRLSAVKASRRKKREKNSACPTSAPAWAATRPPKARTDSAPKPAARKPTSANSRRSGDASSPEKSAVPSAGTRNRRNTRS